MRRSINTRSGFFVRKLDPNRRDISLDDLRQAFKDDSEEAALLLNFITRYAGLLRGTRPFWNSKRHALEAIMRQLDCPLLFITVSAADYHWDSLMRHMPQYDTWLTAT